MLWTGLSTIYKIQPGLLFTVYKGLQDVAQLQFAISDCAGPVQSRVCISEAIRSGKDPVYTEPPVPIIAGLISAAQIHIQSIVIRTPA